MSISPVKRLILETMWMLEKPAKASEIAKAAGLSFPQAMMHVIGLVRMGYAQMPEKGTYSITENGKRGLGLPEIGREKATEILSYLPAEKSFHFYVDIGKPLNIHAASLGDFCDKISKIDASSLEFHVNRGDFEAWFSGLGDAELARKTLFIREQKIAGEDLRKRLCEIVKNRCDLLVKIRGASSQSNTSSNVRLT